MRMVAGHCLRSAEALVRLCYTSACQSFLRRCPSATPGRPAPPTLPKPAAHLFEAIACGQSSEPSSFCLGFAGGAVASSLAWLHGEVRAAPRPRSPEGCGSLARRSRPCRGVCRRSSVAEQPFCKRWRGGSSPSAGTKSPRLLPSSPRAMPSQCRPAPGGKLWRLNRKRTGCQGGRLAPDDCVRGLLSSRQEAA